MNSEILRSVEAHLGCKLTREQADKLRKVYNTKINRRPERRSPMGESRIPAKGERIVGEWKCK